MNFKAFVSVCDEVGEIAVSGVSHKSTKKHSELPIILEELEDDSVLITNDDLGLSAKVGGAKNIDAISILICKDKVTVIPKYSVDEMNLYGCCACCTRNGTEWCVYGSSGCVCC